jgi:dTMP kinase
LLAARLVASGRVVRELREPGGTPLGEEIRHTLKHSAAGAGMTPEAELLLINAARAQLVRDVIRPALAAGEVVVCDRFTDSTTAYQGWGRQLAPEQVAAIIDLAVGVTRPDLTLLIRVSPEVSVARRRHRVADGRMPITDRFEDENAAFFERVGRGFEAVAAQEPGRVRVIDGDAEVEVVSGAIWAVVAPFLEGGSK